MKSYLICNEADIKIFEKQCAALEKKISSLSNKKIIEDVDGSVVAMYDLHGKKVSVKNDTAVGGVFIETDVSLEDYFK